MCNKVDNRVECLKCGYPFSEAAFSDRPEDYGGPLPCDSTDEEIADWLEDGARRMSTGVPRPFVFGCRGV